MRHAADLPAMSERSRRRRQRLPELWGRAERGRNGDPDRRAVHGGTHPSRGRSGQRRAQRVDRAGIQVRRRGWSLADRIAGVATVVLFISLFLSWFGISVIGITVTASGVSAHGYLYIVMILSILIVAYLVLRAGWDELPGGIDLPHLTTMMAATLVNLIIVFLAFIFKPGGSGVGWEFGAFLALIAAIVAAAPYAIPQLRAKTMG